MNSFFDFPLYKPFITALHTHSITKPTPVQERVIPLLLEHTHVFFESETGTGKTLAFLLPLLTKIVSRLEEKAQPSLLIVTPTIELASQIKETLTTLQEASCIPLKTVLCIGGSSIKRQIDALKEKPPIVIGTPARIADLMSLKKLKLDRLYAIVIDEADRLLARESIEALRAVLAHIPEPTQITACSATFNEKNRTLLTALFSRQAAFTPIFAGLGQDGVLSGSIEHWAFFSERKHKTDTLRMLLHALPPEKVLIFAAPAHEVETITQKLQYKKLDAQPLYSNLSGNDRKSIIRRFKSGKIRILVTSDLSARGLDISGVQYVIQMNISKDREAFIHRAGRTGRAGQKGVNIVLGDEYELRLLQKIEKQLKIRIQPKMLFEGKISNPPPVDDEQAE
ncbi:MAG: DEAD/DEAH box helicase [Treponema sp.]